VTANVNGFTIEFLFLAFCQLSFEFSLSEMTRVFYTGAFEVITYNWKKNKNSAWTQRIPLDLFGDLVIRSRGVFSDFARPAMYRGDAPGSSGGKRLVKGHGALHAHVNEVIKELEDHNIRNRMDNSLQVQALITIDSLHLHSPLIQQRLESCAREPRFSTSSRIC
jgi:hypothetical protein